MVEFQYEGDPVIVCRDRGYPLVELLSPENRKKARERVKNPDYVNSKYKLKELFVEIGIIVNPEGMTYISAQDLYFNRK
jgi:hypothetical protein